MAMIKLTGINKIYRTNEIETLALENVNLDVEKGEFVSIIVPQMWKIYSLEYHGAVGCTQ